MATVFQIVATNENGLSETGIVGTGEWHASVSIDDPRTVCGIQLMGEDGYCAGPDKQGRVTCGICRSVIEQVQAIKQWK